MLSNGQLTGIARLHIVPAPPVPEPKCQQQADRRAQAMSKRVTVVETYLWISETPQISDGQWWWIQKRGPSWKQVVRQSIISSRSFAWPERPGFRFPLMMGAHQAVQRAQDLVRGICLFLLAAGTQTSSLHGIDSTAQEVMGILLPARLKMFSNV